MDYRNLLLVVSDLERSKKFYQDTLGLQVILDFGENVTLTGGVCLQSKESWSRLTHLPENELSDGANDHALYFEEENFDAFAGSLARMPAICYVHPVQEHRWGQRVVRFYDPDGHIIEVGEPMPVVCKRFREYGMTEEEVAVRMDVPVQYVHDCLQKLSGNGNRNG